MTKKTILFIGLMVCFLGVLAYVETLEREKQEQAELLEQTELKQTEISEHSAEATGNKSRNNTEETEIFQAEKDDKWANITPEYFLTEDIFDTDARTDFTEFDTSENEGLYETFVRRWYNENNISLITLTVIKHKDRNFDLESYVLREPGSTSKISEDIMLTEMGSFTFQNEIIRENKLETTKEQGVETTFSLNWLNNTFSFSIKTIFSEYQDDMREIAKNIINKYPK